jgi:hypothetical protein
VWTINKIGDVSNESIRSFKGFLACLLYSTAHKEFANLIEQHWDALHEFSGRPILVLVAAAPATRRRSSNSTGASIPSGAAQYMTIMPNFEPIGTNAANAEMVEHFGIKRASMPCIVFFDQINNATSLSYSFRDFEDLPSRFMEIFDDCHSVWKPPSSDEDVNLPEYRRRKMVELGPLLRRRKFLKAISLGSKNPSIAAILGTLNPYR